MIRLNLLPPEKRTAREQRLLLRRVIKTNAIALTVVALVIGMLFGGRLLLVQHRNQLDFDTQTEVQRQQQSTDGAPIDTRISRINARLSELQTMQSTNVHWIPLILRSATLIPEQIPIQTLRFDSEQRRIEVSGIAPTRNDFLQLTTNFERDPLFQTVEYPVSLLTDSVDISFSLQIDLSPEYDLSDFESL